MLLVSHSGTDALGRQHRLRHRALFCRRCADVDPGGLHRHHGGRLSNARAIVSAKKEGENEGREQFNTAFRAGGVMGFSLCALSLMILYLLCLIYRHVLQIDGEVDNKHLFEYTAGYSLGGSTIAIGRVGGGTAETPGRDLNFCLSSKLQSCADNVSSREFRQPEQKAGCLIRSLLETPQ